MSSLMSFTTRGTFGSILLLLAALIQSGQNDNSDDADGDTVNRSPGNTNPHSNLEKSVGEVTPGGSASNDGKRCDRSGNFRPADFLSLDLGAGEYYRCQWWSRSVKLRASIGAGS